MPDLILGWLVAGHRVLWMHDAKDVRGGDFCFYLSFSQIVPSRIREKFKHNLVVHESDLPKGKGWSPLTWQILEGKNCVPITLIEAADKVDSGLIYIRDWMEFEGHELIDELRRTQAGATVGLCRKFVDDYPKVLEAAQEQAGEESFYPRRCPANSELNVRKTIAEQFDLLRVADNERYPAFFTWRGRQYRLKIGWL